MAFAKFQENRFRIDGEIAENHAILVNVMASIGMITVTEIIKLKWTQNNLIRGRS